MDVLETKLERPDRDGFYICKGGRVNILVEEVKMELLGRRQRGKSMRRFMGVVREDMQIISVRKKMRRKIHCGDSLEKVSKAKK